jgi:hypothetical protein
MQPANKRETHTAFHRQLAAAIANAKKKPDDPKSIQCVIDVLQASFRPCSARRWKRMIDVGGFSPGSHMAYLSNIFTNIAKTAKVSVDAEDIADNDYAEEYFPVTNLLFKNNIQNLFELVSLDSTGTISNYVLAYFGQENSNADLSNVLYNEFSALIMASSIGKKSRLEIMEIIYNYMLNPDTRELASQIFLLLSREVSQSAGSKGGFVLKSQKTDDKDNKISPTKELERILLKSVYILEKNGIPENIVKEIIGNIYAA